jgi:quercetin dioxygenase-like cupin family protein
LPELASNTREIENEHTFQQTEQHSEFIPEFDPRGLSVYTIANDDSGWMPHPITGISVKPLASDKSRGYSTLLMRLASGTCFPSHSHSGAEQCFVVQGSINVLNKTLVSGDFLSTKAGADHGNITSTNGATVLLVVALEDYNKSAWKVLASSLFHRWKSVLNK